ncbi:amylo-alpha-1,6-glucosidase [Curtobacterium ammoniigenes]|uniref:amylo-alpha-1,6-glucosidase n=1 Tax=Curtobacterium ammoniigenes TaxID=395387 RepID=UPI000829D872|nr:glycogen debranching N-terminal domain-containing protein [Curtobacterium ammoniigenes]
MTGPTTTTTTAPIRLAPLQPLLHDAIVTLRAPAQVWSDRHGDIDGRGVHGYWVGDQRVVSRITVSVARSAIEPLDVVADRADETTFSALLRGLDAPGADPDVRLDRRRQVRADGVDETLTVSTRLAPGAPVDVTVRIQPDATGMDPVKQGAEALSADPTPTADGARWRSGGTEVVLQVQGATATVVGGTIVLRWHATASAGAPVSCTWTVTAATPDAVVRGADSAVPWSVPDDVGDDRLSRWLARASTDLDALRMRRATGEDEFFAAGAPWFFTLFGRDSLWAARFLLPVDWRLAASTLRVLAELQGSQVDPSTAEQPGKIMHEIRQASLPIDNPSMSLPPLYYGTVDATPLWICVLYDAWKAGMPDAAVRELLPAMERALAWMRDFGDSDDDGLLEYVDESGRGLSNQGWKDSGDSVQWQDGTLATGPIALCEVQAYAYEAAVHGAELLDAFGRAGGDAWRSWAARLAERFRAAFWLAGPRGRYPAIALDAAKRPVDTVTSNIGHLLGTGLLSTAEEREVASRLVEDDMSSGFGLRTMSSEASGYWPLSYHGGSVWTHDTAIAIVGLTRSGFRAEARLLAEGLLRAAVAFEFRMPELHSGDPAARGGRPAPYPAACRPQAWSAAAAFPVWVALRDDAA